MICLYYWRKHLPTDTVYIGAFNGSQVPNLAHLPFVAAERECKAALARWNRDAMNTDWIYEYVGVRNEEVARYEEKSA